MERITTLKQKAVVNVDLPHADHLNYGQSRRLRLSPRGVLNDWTPQLSEIKQRGNKDPKGWFALPRKE